jgi:hypothetical protein
MKVKELIESLKNVDSEMEVVVASDFYHDALYAKPMADIKAGRWEEKIFVIVASRNKR